MKYILLLALFLTSYAFSADLEEIKLKELAEKGLAEAEYNLALYYELKAADQCYIKGQYNLDNMYADCEGAQESEAVKRFRFETDTKAVKWYRKAADQGHVVAQTSLGIMYDFGKGVLENDAEAVKWFLKAAQQGEALAQHNLALMYEEGTGVPQSYLKAQDWYIKAANQDHLMSQHNLGLMYQKGTGVSQSDTEAHRWFSKASSQGQAASQNNLALMYVNGAGVKQSMIAAYIWWEMSSIQGEKVASDNLAILKTMMSSKAIETAKSAAAKCYEANYKDCEVK